MTGLGRVVGDARKRNQPRCTSCDRPLVGEHAWATDWIVVDADGTRAEVRYTCDDCEADR